MQSLNLYILTRNAKEFCTEYENVLANREHKCKIKEYEYETVVSLVEYLCENDVNIEELDGFYFSYVIEYIGKEFDLLKIDKGNMVLNIELKSDFVPEEKIRKQLVQNKYYLSHLAPNIKLFTYQQKTKQLYTLEQENLKLCKMKELVVVLKSFRKFENGDISDLFHAKDFLISPLNTSENFVRGNYFLTNQQNEIKKEIMKKGVSDRTNLLWGITGNAGTGKTLLLYDIVKTCCEIGRCCIIHSGILCEGHEKLNGMLNNVDIISAKFVEAESLVNYRFVFVDEAQRIYTETLETILDIAEEHGIMLIFSYDFFQVLSKLEQKRNIPNRLREISGFAERTLTDKVRTNKEAASFIRNLLNLNDISDTVYKYNNIDVIFANDEYEAKKMINFYTNKKGYIFIGYTQSIYISSSIDKFPGDIDTHHVIGQEFDNVLIMMDDNFRYGEDGRLQGKEHPNPDYIFYKLFYQGISRVREKLCILVIGNRDLFEKIVEIKFNNIS